MTVEFSALNLIVVTLLCAATALMAHLGVAVFHDGIRPVLPEFIEGRMKRPEMASVAFGLSVGFIASVGIAHTVATGILNPWLLFLTTDILGIVANRKWLAALLGGAWGALTVSALGLINTALTSLPVDFIGAMGALSDPVVSGFALFPLVAIFMQFGAKKGVTATAITFIVRILIVRFTTIYVESIQIFVGVLLLIIFAIAKDTQSKLPKNEEEDNVFTERIARIRKNVVFLMIGGAFIAVACNIGVFAGSEVSIYTLAEAYKTGNNALVSQAALSEFMRGLGFIPLIATTAITTGVYGVAGLTFVYPIGYLMPNPIFAAIGGALMILVEVMLLGLIGKFLGKFPSIREASDSIRSSMTTVMEFALLIGAINAVVKMGGYTGFFIGAMIYFINEMTGRRIMKMAIGPVAAIATGIILNILCVLGLFVPIA
ncbi:YhfT family protein [Harryflintia acetispora]|uniref:YhfT family protein n=1 Tax=Harryflintia acetispora TaxID=1849041 RepID=UPI001897632C|nr:YhfT family protein [Harryflintia acetispora]